MTKIKMQYIINFHWRVKLKQIKTSIPEIRNIKHNQKIRDWNEKFHITEDYRALSPARDRKEGTNVHWPTGPSLVTFPCNALDHTVEEMEAHLLTRQMVIFNRESRHHTLNEWGVRPKSGSASSGCTCYSQPKLLF